MPWTNVPTKNPGDPVTAENWNGLVGNFAGMAEGGSGAPRVAIPEAVTTAEIDPAKTLRPDGAGGVAWGPAGAGLGGGIVLGLSGQVVVVPEHLLTYAISGPTVMGSTTIVVPNPSPAIAGHLVAVEINTVGGIGGGFLGGGTIHQGSESGPLILQWPAGSRCRCILVCTGSTWMVGAYSVEE